MRSVAAVFAWDFRQRLRWGLIACSVYFTILAAVQVVAGERSPIHPLREMTFAFTVSIPLCAAFMYFVAVFSYGLAGDLTARQSLYPARMFTLPVSTGALAGWPMLYGTLAMAALWTATAVIALWPVRAPVPLVWPGFFVAAFLAWLQALTWMPYGLPGLRLIAAVLLLTSIDAVVFTAVELKVRESVMVTMLAPQVPLAYLAARYALGRARRGDTPDWGSAWSRLGRWIAAVLPRGDARFASDTRAQAWLEWRQHGRSLPAWVAVVAPFEIVFLYLVRGEPMALTGFGLVVMVLTPPFLAAFVAVTVGRSREEAGSAYGLAPFVATRPLTTRSLGAEKLRMALRSTLLAWLLVVVAVVAGLSIAGRWPAVFAETGALTDFFGVPRAIAITALAVLALLTLTWKQIVQGLAIGLTGREALVKSSVLVRLASLVLIGLLVYAYNLNRDLRVFLWNSVLWLPVLPVGLKLGLAAAIAARLRRARLVGERALLAGAAGWVVIVLALYGVLAWIFDLPHVANGFLLLISILAVPLVRPSAVLLALASSRHRGTIPSSPGSTGQNPARRAVLALLGAPLALAAAMLVSFEVRNRDDGRVVSGGDERTYRLYVPTSYDARRPTPLVISLHGASLWGAAQMEISQWGRVADEHGIIVAFPSGRRTAGPRVWREDQAGRSSRDVRFISDLIDAVGAAYNIDPARIYADGFSNGGGMAFALSCALPDRIAAVGMVGPALFLSWDACRDRTRPVPMILFHGTAERFAPYRGGTSMVSNGVAFPSIPDFVATGARRNQCAPDPLESRVAPDVMRRAYSHCAGDADVVLYTIEGGGHTWPGDGRAPTWFLGRATRSLDASREAWAFFRAHPLRVRAATSF